MTDRVTYHVLSRENAAMLDKAEAFDNAVDPEQLKTFVSRTGHELVFARLGDRVIGFASGNVLLHPDKPPVFFINEVGVLRDMRRQGIASALCRKLIQQARGAGCQGIWLATEKENDAARALYHSLRARETGGIVVYDWDDAMGA
ncbi:GNAT family N-acetyltransferase [Aliiroseovarius sp. F47248L]|uniref:GNAT family N-acetyltransferase n=1 Tax=Aliiroseovarius sp. F47248L TaxID=2926420 RepID=UPI001FF507ED|nr:GNAT family N-acetyltransferase [Aliiroseovarius sp. F47248L]MCK0137581.1 GNAT family N-acetyltransferase [Aliiroseovarius sp. F47248L]